MEEKRLIKASAVALGCASATVALPFIGSYLATVSLPFFGTVLGSVFKTQDFNESLGKVIVNTASDILTNVGSTAIELIPDGLGSEHNLHLEELLATAYLEGLQAVETEFKASEDEKIKEQTEQVFPLVKARLEKGLKVKKPFMLFPLQTKSQAVEEAFANSLSAENISLLLADEEKWREQLGDEVEISLRRWLDEERADKERSTQRTQLGLAMGQTQLPEPLRSRLRRELPPRIAHLISELVTLDDFKAAWIGFQRSYLQAILRVVHKIETSQTDIAQSVDALKQRIANCVDQTEFVTAVAEKLQIFLSQLSLPQERLEQLLDRQLIELRGVEERLTLKIEEGNRTVVDKISYKIRQVTDELKGEILKGAIRATQNRLRQLPAAPRDFTGRKAELRELHQALTGDCVTILSVHGLGGVGKTALALKLAHDLKDYYGDAQIYLDLKGVGPQPLTPPDVMWHVISSFRPEMNRPDDADLPTWYNSLLNANQTLLLYDNAKDATQIAPLLPPENCLLMITSRRHFTLRGMINKNLEEMTHADAEELLLRIAPRAGGHAAPIAAQCGYLPIALCATASALKAHHKLSPEDYLKRLRDRNDRLSLRDETTNMTVEASFDLSYELLNEKLRQRWRMLSIFPADFDEPAAATVWQTDADDALYSLEELENYSLLGWKEDTRRYNLHDLVRDFADKHMNADERERAGLFHAAHYFLILATVGDLYLLGGERMSEAIALFDKEFTNILTGQKWASARYATSYEAAELCEGYAVAAGDVLFVRLQLRDNIRWQEVALHSAQKLSDSLTEATALDNLGHVYFYLGENRTAIDYYQQALALAQKSGDKYNECNSLNGLGNAYGGLREFRTAIDYLKRSLTIARQISDKWLECNALTNLGVVNYDLGKVRTSIDYHKLSLTVAREIGYRSFEGHILSDLGAGYQSIGKVRTAIKHYQQALAIVREVGDRRAEGHILSNIGRAYSFLGKIKMARRFMEEGLAILDELEAPDAKRVRQWLNGLHTWGWLLRLGLTPLGIIGVRSLEKLFGTDE
jgi:tetratricopeptide (TPR) repeat protein